MVVVKPVYQESGYNLFLRGMRNDLCDAAACLECYSTENFWTKKDISKLLRHYRIDGWFVSAMNTPVAYTIFEKKPKKQEIHLLNLVVHPDYRRLGIGTYLLGRINVVFANLFDVIIADVRESNLSAQLFFRENGFLAKRVTRGYFQDFYAEHTEIEDAYSFRKELKICQQL